MLSRFLVTMLSIAMRYKAVKLLRNGQLLIEKNGVRYNAMGQIVR